MTGIRPEYLIPVLSAESGLNPGLQNRAGHDYWGLNQLSGKFLRDNGVNPQEYLTWSASEQLNGPILTFLGRTAQSFGTPKSALRTYQLNFAPATLRTAKKLTDPIYSSPSASYTANRALDKNNKGYISVADLGQFVQKEIDKPEVKAAIDAAYAERPERSVDRKDPLLGEDFQKDGDSKTQSYFFPILLGGLLVGAAAYYAFYLNESAPKRRMA